MEPILDTLNPHIETKEDIREKLTFLQDEDHIRIILKEGHQFRETPSMKVIYRGKENDTVYFSRIEYPYLTKRCRISEIVHLSSN